jgi:ABC-type sulfate transport system substrate-binding protein
MKITIALLAALLAASAVQAAPKAVTLLNVSYPVFRYSRPKTAVLL